MLMGHLDEKQHVVHKKCLHPAFQLAIFGKENLRKVFLFSPYYINKLSHKTHQLILLGRTRIEP
nr:hypothetical protein Iba_chr04aCG23760 [Ipomoea batatas]